MSAWRLVPDGQMGYEWDDDGPEPAPPLPAELLPCGHWSSEDCGHPELDADPSPARPARLSLRQERVRRALTRSPEEQTCECPPCPGKGYDGNGVNHCAECCFGTLVEADIACPVHGDPDSVSLGEPSPVSPPVDDPPPGGPILTSGGAT